jgi:hypothetical protein
VIFISPLGTQLSLHILPSFRFQNTREHLFQKLKTVYYDIIPRQHEEGFFIKVISGNSPEG